MSGTIIVAIIFAVLAGGMYALRRIYGNGAPVAENHDHHDGENGVCCGKHSNCEKGYDTANLYFDDEELDRFKGKKPEEYNETDIEEFRQVLYTMREEEVENWAHCIETRGIELPTEIREEILLMLQ